MRGMHEYAVYRIGPEHEGPETVQQYEAWGLFPGDRVAALNTAAQAKATAHEFYEAGGGQFSYVARKESTGRILLRLGRR